MKILLLFGICLFALYGFTQERRMIPLKGKILDSDSVGVGDAYIINLKGLLLSISSDDGSFNIWADPGDSLVVTHISFVRKIVVAKDVFRNPLIFLEINSVMLKQVVIGDGIDPQEKSLKKTIEKIKNAEIKVYKRMDPEANRIGQFVTENNIVLRSQASSVSLASISPSKILALVKNDKKKALKQKGYNFYRNEKQKARKEMKKAIAD
jgi:hypothetical protein